MVVLIDYPGFNLRMAKFAHKKGMKVVFYISPTIWAWKQSRVYIVKKYVDRMMVILPFEKDFYAKFGYRADFVGHPLLDELTEEKRIPRDKFLKQNKLDERPIVAVLPGSRVQEIKKILPKMLSVKARFSAYQFVVAGVKSVPEEVYLVKGTTVVFDQTHALLHHADAALVASGTATLEAALPGVPQVVCYQASPASYFIARLLVHIKFISLVNLILDKEVVKELIQHDFSKKNLQTELHLLLENSARRKRLLSDYVLLRTKLGTSGASKNAAVVINEFLKTAVHSI